MKKVQGEDLWDMKMNLLDFFKGLCLIWKEESEEVTRDLH